MLRYEVAHPQRKNAAGMLKITASLSTPLFDRARSNRYTSYAAKNG